MSLVDYGITEDTWVNAAFSSSNYDQLSNIEALERTPQLVLLLELVRMIGTASELMIALSMFKHYSDGTVRTNIREHEVFSEHGRVHNGLSRSNAAGTQEIHLSLEISEKSKSAEQGLLLSKCLWASKAQVTEVEASIGRSVARSKSMHTNGGLNGSFNQILVRPGRTFALHDNPCTNIGINLRNNQGFLGDIPISQHAPRGSGASRSSATGEPRQQSSTQPRHNTRSATAARNSAAESQGPPQGSGSDASGSGNGSGSSSGSGGGGNDGNRDGRQLPAGHQIDDEDGLGNILEYSDDDDGDSIEERGFANVEYIYGGMFGASTYLVHNPDYARSSDVDETGDDGAYSTGDDDASGMGDDDASRMGHDYANDARGYAEIESSDGESSDGDVPSTFVITDDEVRHVPPGVTITDGFLQALVAARVQIDEMNDDSGSRYEDDTEEFYDSTRVESHDDYLYESDNEKSDYPSEWNYSREVRGRKYNAGGSLVSREKIPNPNMATDVFAGDFGPHRLPSLRNADRFLRPVSVVDHLLNRQLGGTESRYNSHVELSMRYIPSNPGKYLYQYNGRPAYGGRFSADGKFFYIYLQDFSVLIYDVSDVYRPRLLRSIRQEHLRNHSWTITDVAMSKDNSFLVNSSLTSKLTVVKFKGGSADPTSESFETSTINMATRSTPGSNQYYRMAVFSLALSSDSRKLLVGGTCSQGRLAICDMTRPDQLTWFGKQHRNEVNSVKFLDDSEQKIVSGSDDGIIRLWDARTRDSSVNCFVGHTEGITSIDVNSLGVHIISNSKDQTLKMWDTRQPSNEADVSVTSRVMSHFHYQSGDYPGPSLPRHPKDKSIMTYRGHHVFYTTIRCGFSPLNQTGEKFIYSGSSNGHIVIWKLDGQIARILGSNEAYNSQHLVDSLYPLDSAYVSLDDVDHRGSTIQIIREASWHPDAPTIYAPAMGGIPLDGLSTGHLFAYHSGHPMASQLKAKSYELDYDYYKPMKDIQVLNDYYSK